MGIRTEPVARGIGRLTVICALVVAPMTTACIGGDTAASERAVSVGDLQREQYFFEGDHLGQTVTVSAAVSEVHGPHSFELSGGDFRDDTLLVMSDDPVEVIKEQVVRVTGTVGQFHETFPPEGVPYLQTDLYEKYETEVYIYDATVEKLPAQPIS